MSKIEINKLDVVRAWKDEEYFNSLTEEQRSQLPANPAGMIDVSDEDMESVIGGGSCWCCGGAISNFFTNPVVAE
jgi:mersacidin/lichenicidin family type 2 lantibiotic